MAALQAVPEGWVGVVEQARRIGMHPESLRRKMRYGELPEGSYRRIGKYLFFNPEVVSSVVATNPYGAKAETQVNRVYCPDFDRQAQALLALLNSAKTKKRPRRQPRPRRNGTTDE